MDAQTIRWKFNKEDKIHTDSQYLPTKFLLITKGKIHNFTLTKSGGYQIMLSMLQSPTWRQIYVPFNGYDNPKIWVLIVISIKEEEIETEKS